MNVRVFEPMPRLETLPESLEQQTAPTTSVYVAPLPLETAPSPVSSPSLPFLVGETPEGMERASEGEIATAYKAVQEAYTTRNGGRPPATVTAIEVWQEIQSQRARANRERQRVLRETARAKRDQQRRRIAGGSAAAAGIALYFVGRSILPPAMEASVPQNSTNGFIGGSRSGSVTPGVATVTSSVPQQTLPPVPVQTHNIVTMPRGMPGWVTWDTLVQLPQAATQLRNFPGYSPVQPVLSQAVPGASWQISWFGGRLYLDAYAFASSPGSVLAGPITLYPTRGAAGFAGGQTPQPIHVLMDGQDFAGAMHILPTGGSSGEAIQIRLNRLDDRLLQP